MTPNRAAGLLFGAVVMMWSGGAGSQVSDQGKAEVSPPGLGLARWINPATAPFIPVPVVGTDPNSGTTLGVLPTWVHTNDNDEISRIIAPDVIHNPNFGYGIDARIFSYPSENAQWSLVAGINQRVQRTLDVEYQTELSRKQRWSLNYSLIYNRDGSPRFFGLGNRTTKAAQTGYTKITQMAQVQAGLNLNHAWQIQYTFRPQRVDVEPASLSTLVSIERRFPDAVGLGVDNVFLNRLALIFDTRDNFVVPRTGVELVAYGGTANRSSTFGEALYHEAGFDARFFVPIAAAAVLAVHSSLRYMLNSHDVPFWALSTLGGDRDDIGGPQELRGFGAGRYYDRNGASATLEIRQTVLSFDAGGSHIDVEATPFVDVGAVFGASQTDPFAHLHKVGGLGFRGVARPFVVGYVDIGYGSEGVATFTGINYPF